MESAENNTEFTQREEVMDLGSSTTRSSRGVIHCLTIVGQIEGHQLLGDSSKTTKYEHVLPVLAAVEESDEIEGLLVLLNTVGGDIEAGLAIAELIASMTKPTASVVLGGGHSIGVPLAVAAKRSFIVPSAAMTIHPVRVNGTVIGVPQTFNYFAKVHERIVQFVTENSGITKERFMDYMMRTEEMANDVGSVIYGAEAVECGLIDSLGGLWPGPEYPHPQIGGRHRERKKNTAGSSASCGFFAYQVVLSGQIW